MFWNTKKILVTHNGGFHADDIFACATLHIYLDQTGETYTLVRSREEKDFARGDFVFDVGAVHDPARNRFDHHQRGGAGVRTNTVPYAAFGLVWKAYGVSISGNQHVADEIDRMLAQPIDANDNGIDVFTANIEGVTPVTFQDIVGLNYPDDDATEAEYYDAFLYLVSLAKNILQKAINKTKKQFEINAHMKDLYEKAEDKRMIVVEKKYGRFPITMGALSLPELLYVVFPSKRGDDWNVVAARKSVNGMDSKELFPASWAGLQSADFQKLTGIATAKFCHNGRFLCGADTKEDAILLAKLAI